jgi:hypothetical protein
MPRLPLLLLCSALLLPLTACTISRDGGGRDDDDDDAAGSCDACSDSEICIIDFFDADATDYRCDPIPDVCGDIASCTDVECVSAMYDFCPEDTSGWGCSDTFPPTMISCNP